MKSKNLTFIYAVALAAIVANMVFEVRGQKAFADGFERGLDAARGEFARNPVKVWLGGKGCTVSTSALYFKDE